MDAEQLAELRRRAAAATPGPWYAQPDDLIGGWCVGTLDIPPSRFPHPSGDYYVASFVDEAHARYLELIDPQSLLSLISHAERQQTTLRRIREIIAIALLADPSFVPLGAIDVLAAGALGEDVS